MENKLTYKLLEQNMVVCLQEMENRPTILSLTPQSYTELSDEMGQARLSMINVCGVTMGVNNYGKENCFTNNDKTLQFTLYDRIEITNINLSKINHPDHYGKGEDDPFEVIKIIEHYNLNFTEGNILKYLLRYKKKNGIEDIKKCQWYVNRLVQFMEK